MKTAKYKTGDSVEIVPHKDHADYVKKRYGIVHKIVNVIRIGFDNYLYELKGIEAYAEEEELIIYKNKQL